MNNNIEKIENFEIYYDQYKLMVQTTQKISEQRIQTNKFYLTLNTISITILFSMPKMNISGTFFFMGLFSVLLTIINMTWKENIKHYRNINAAKFQIINEMEKNLPFELFSKEWETVNKRREHRSLTTIEERVPKVLTIFFIICTIITEGYELYLKVPLFYFSITISILLIILLIFSLHKYYKKHKKKKTA